MKLTMKKDHFLSNLSNRQSFNNNYSEQVSAEGWLPNTSLTANADLLIVQTAVESARRARTVLVGNDNDLILLCYYTEISA